LLLLLVSERVFFSWWVRRSDVLTCACVITEALDR
jgi:hypothetical protein